MVDSSISTFPMGQRIGQAKPSLGKDPGLPFCHHPLPFLRMNKALPAYPKGLIRCHSGQTLPARIHMTPIACLIS